VWANAKDYTPAVVGSLYQQALDRVDEVEPPALRDLVRETLRGALARCHVITSTWGEHELIALMPLAEAITGPDWDGKPVRPHSRMGG